MPIANRFRVVGGAVVATLALGGAYAGTSPTAPLHGSDVELSASEHRAAEEKNSARQQILDDLTR